MRSKGKIVTGKYNHHDSYYSQLGKEVVESYFNGMDILDYTEGNDNPSFLKDGLFCEYAYIYNEDNDTLEIYRGFFHKPQFKGHQGYHPDYGKKEHYYCHLIFAADKKIHTKEQALAAFERYEEERNLELENDYPERAIVPFEFKKEHEWRV